MDINNIIKSKIQKFIKLNDSSSLILKTSNRYNIKKINKSINIFINLELINNIRWINKFHESVNMNLNIGNYYVICSETLEERRKIIFEKSPFGFKTLIRVFDFIYKRVLPKLPFFKKIYFSITRGHNRVLSKAEILGRLISCGFEIVEYFEHSNLFYVISKKNTEPDYNLNPSYSPVFKMKRIGFQGKIIRVYKLRTMYPYSEYLQDLIIKENKLAKSGKVLNDYRITTWGRFCRKFWIDELPMILNFLRGDLNIVGVRPLSIVYFKKYPKDIQDMRLKIKPGLIPPYYADMPKNFDEILESEKRYLKSKFKNPLLTDIKYFYMSFVNIIFKGARSN